ncbi:MAG: hypothetical protein JWM28_920 [Chitinophagaceae bacterium]|nr:hypothetical protein [Chitinophagaceae bacterium]
MPPFNPLDVIFPKNRILRVVRVLHDGIINNPIGFCIAELELHDGIHCFGIRHNWNDWNEENPDIGYPTCRPGNPTWFILPNPQELIFVMNNVFNPERTTLE